MAMKMLVGYSLCLLFLLSFIGQPAAARRLHFGTCSLRVHIHELQTHYAVMEKAVKAADSELGVKLLKAEVMKNVPEGESCCFLHLLMRFYVERVFGSYASSQPQHRRSISALANSFVIINKDLRQCHCHCGEATRNRIDSLQTAFMKLEVEQAALKAVGELNYLLEWLEGFNQNKHQTER